MARGKLSRESIAQAEAFEIYYNMGSKRSLKLVAEQVGKTERTMAEWSRAGNWVDRVTQRDIEAGKIEGSINAKTTDVRSRYRILINNLMAKASEKIAKGELKIESIQDLERLVKLDLLLMGEPTEKVEAGGSTELSQADKERLDNIARMLGKCKKKE